MLVFHCFSICYFLSFHVRSDLFTVQMSGNKVGLLDLSASSDASPQLFVDLMAGDRSIIRRVFGNTFTFCCSFIFFGKSYSFSLAVHSSFT